MAFRDTAADRVGRFLAVHPDRPTPDGRWPGGQFWLDENPMGRPRSPVSSCIPAAIVKFRATPRTSCSRTVAKRCNVLIRLSAVASRVGRR